MTLAAEVVASAGLATTMGETAILSRKLLLMEEVGGLEADADDGKSGFDVHRLLASSHRSEREPCSITGTGGRSVGVKTRVVVEARESVWRSV